MLRRFLGLTFIRVGFHPTIDFGLQEESSLIDLRFDQPNFISMDDPRFIK